MGTGTTTLPSAPRPRRAATRAPRSRALRDAAASRLCTAGGLSVVAFWVLYFAGVLEPGAGDPAVRAFESAFPVADGVLAAALFGAAAALGRRHRAGPFLLAMAGAMALYLGLLDTTFYGARGLNRPGTPEGALELVLNLACVGGGGWAIVRAWRMTEASR